MLVEAAPDLRKKAEVLYGTKAHQALAGYSDEQLEFLIGFLRGSVAYQEERLRRLEAVKAQSADT